MSVKHYLRFEEASPVKHEYVAGELHALAGASKRQNEITVNIATRLAPAARGGPCRAYLSDVKLRAAEDVFYYPDVGHGCLQVEHSSVIADAASWIALPGAAPW